MGRMKALYSMGGFQRRQSLAGLEITIKDYFFDRELVQELLDKEGRDELNRMGARIRKVARSSIKRKGKARKPPKNVDGRAYQRWLEEQKNKPRSAPGQPVFQHTDHPSINPKNIWYAFDGADSVVVGMGKTLARSGAPVPKEIEFGSEKYAKNPRRRIRKLGGGGEVRVGGRVGRTSKRAVKTRVGDVMVTYATLRTAAQVAKANAINEGLYGPWTFRVKTAPRPVMAPALEKAAQYGYGFTGRLVGGSAE